MTGVSGHLQSQITGGGNPDAEYLLVGSDEDLGNARTLSPGSGISSIDGGGGSSYTINVDYGNDIQPILENTSEGDSPSLARSNHTHQGVYSISNTTDGTGLFG